MALTAGDLFVVNRAGTSYKLDYTALQAALQYTLPTATAGGAGTGTLGGVKVDGTTVTIDANGVIKANVPGALTYKGTIAPAGPVPTGPATGDVYIFSGPGTLADPAWGTVNGSAVTTGDMLIRQAAGWDLILHAGSAAAGSGVRSISATANSGVSVTGGNTGTPVIAGVDASATVKGVVQLADAAAITAGTSTTLAVTVAQLDAAKAVYASSAETLTGTVTNKSVTPAGAKATYLPLNFSTLTALP